MSNEFYPRLSRFACLLAASFLTSMLQNKKENRRKNY